MSLNLTTEWDAPVAKQFMDCSQFRWNALSRAFFATGPFDGHAWDYFTIYNEYMAERLQDNILRMICHPKWSIDMV